MPSPSSRPSSTSPTRRSKPTATPRRRALPRVLLTGFDPFGGQHINPSWQAVQALDGAQIEGHTLVVAQLPTQFGRSLTALNALLTRHRPALVLCVGQADGRSGLSVERVAININDARIPDNGQQQPVDTPVVPGGPAAYFTNLPIKAMVQALQGEGLAASVSQTAGTFVCNHVFYGLMHRLATRPALASTRGGFIHVPSLPEQVADPLRDPNMPVADIVRGLHVLIQAALTHQTDLRLGAGALD